MKRNTKYTFYDSVLEVPNCGCSCQSARNNQEKKYFRPFVFHFIGNTLCFGILMFFLSIVSLRGNSQNSAVYIGEDIEISGIENIHNTVSNVENIYLIDDATTMRETDLHHNKHKRHHHRQVLNHRNNFKNGHKSTIVKAKDKTSVQRGNNIFAFVGIGASHYDVCLRRTVSKTKRNLYYNLCITNVEDIKYIYSINNKSTMTDMVPNCTIITCGFLNSFGPRSPSTPYQF
ncbi:MAG: hypothetical protein FWD66_02050 [Paludibacter sp.]|nr:hypothetical protein [Paludibacter sp.]